MPKNPAKNPGITRRELGGLVAGAIASSPLQIQAQVRAAAIDPVLDIAEWTY